MFLSEMDYEFELQNNEATIYAKDICKRKKRNSKNGIQEITNTKTNICINGKMGRAVTLSDIKKLRKRLLKK